MAGDPEALGVFVGDLHLAFWISAGVGLVAALQPSHSPRAAAQPSTVRAAS